MILTIRWDSPTKKLSNNILTIVCNNFFNWLGQFLRIAFLRDSKTYSIVLNDPKKINSFFCIWIFKNARRFQIRWNNWKQMHLKKVTGRKLKQNSNRIDKIANCKFLQFFALNCLISNKTRPSKSESSLASQNADEVIGLQDFQKILTFRVH